MRKNQKYAALVGIAAMIGMALWMREIASWRPVLVGNKIYASREMRVSRDGRWLWTFGEGMAETFALDPPSPRPAVLPYRIVYVESAKQAFHAAHGVDTFPGYWFDEKKQVTYFVRRKGDKPVKLPGVIISYSGALGWSLARQEIYSADSDAISIWAMGSGRLKRRVRFAKEYVEEMAFSPDGQWLMWANPNNSNYVLHRAETQTGKAAPDLAKLSGSERPVGFSPDGKYFLVAGSGNSKSATVFDAATWQRLWSAKALSARFSPDGRLGIVKTDGFEWRDIKSGKLLQTQRNPSKGTEVWTISPDGKWIYAENGKKQIVRWRAR